MLLPVLVRANYKIATSQVVTLENLVGSNLPLLFPELLIYNRTSTSDTIVVSGVRSTIMTGQVDPDFNGTFTHPLFVSFGLSNGLSQAVSGLGGSLLPSTEGISTILTIANSGGAAEARVTLILRGKIESSIRPDPLVVVNV